MRPSATFNEALALSEPARPATGGTECRGTRCRSGRVTSHGGPAGTSFRSLSCSQVMTTTADRRPTDPATTSTLPSVTARHFGLAVLALAMGGFAIGTTEFVTMGLLPQIADGVDVSIPTGGHVISAYAVGVVVGAPVLAFLGARLPRRALLVALMARLRRRQRR